MPYHAFVGTFLYVLGLATASLGILEKVTFLQDSGIIGYHARELYLADCLGLAIWVTGAAVLLTLLEPWKKVPAPESEYAMA